MLAVRIWWAHTSNTFVHVEETALQNVPPSAEARGKGESCLLELIMRSKICQQLTDSGGRCPALCLRGGRGLTWVTWRKGEPLVGRVDRHSHDAEWVRGVECGGAEGVGEGLASSPRPANTQNNYFHVSSHFELFDFDYTDKAAIIKWKSDKGSLDSILYSLNENLWCFLTFVFSVILH